MIFNAPSPVRSLFLFFVVVFVPVFRLSVAFSPYLVVLFPFLSQLSDGTGRTCTERCCVAHA